MSKTKNQMKKEGIKVPSPEQKKTQRKRFFLNLLFLLVAVVLYSIGVCFFFGPSGLTPGGLSGVSIALERFGILPFGKGVIVLILNIPLLILGIVKFGMRFFSSTMTAIALSSGIMELIDRFVIPESYAIAPLPAAIGGGVIIGFSVGLLLRAGATFGGTDIVVKVLHLRYKYLRTGSFYLIVDGVIVLFGTVTAMILKGGVSLENFDPEILIYSALAIFIQSYFANLMLYGTQGARMVYIITNRQKEITDRITRELHTGVTCLHGKGAYTNEDRQILLCAVRRQNLPGAKEIVVKEDPAAFMIVTGANQVLGKGFKPLDEEDL